MPLLKDTLNATLWSVLAEIIAKIISPAVFLILTHILSPSDFGVVSVATTILGLIYVVSDMGTSKVLIQAEDDEGNIQKLYDAAFYLTYIIHSGFISGYQNRYGDNLKPPTNVYHRMTA